MSRRVFLILSLLAAASAAGSNSGGWGFVSTSVSSVKNKQHGTPSPTMGPTESPAPSPSPSEAPTTAPSATAKPTTGPTVAPTESPAPSPSPSEAPTEYPTQSPSDVPSFQPTTTRFPTNVPSSSPSLMPSSQPSSSPTFAPTRSAMPSSKPSASPSLSPSSSPTLSHQPSSSPSAFPTISSQPSSQPTFVGSEAAIFSTTFPLTNLLTQPDVVGFQYGTEEWILQIPGYGTHYSEPQVTLKKQSLVRAPNVTSSRVLQSTATSGNSTLVLRLDFQVTVTYTGPETTLSLFQVLNPLIQEPADLWIHLLGNYDQVFLQLGSGAVSASQLSTTANATSLSIIGLIAIIVVSGTAIALAISASIFSIRSHKLSVYGEELRSPKNTNNKDDSPSGDESHVDVAEDTTIFDTTTQVVQEVLSHAPEEHQPIVSYAANEYMESAEIEANIEQPQFDYQNQQYYQQLQPDSQEQYRTGDVLDTLEQYRNYNQYNVRSRSNQDPPSSMSEVAEYEAYRNKGALVDREQYRTHVTDAAGDFPANMIYQHRNGPPSMANTNVSSLVSGPGNLGAASVHASSYSRSKHGKSGEANQEILLTRSMGGTLGAEAFPQSPSEVSSHAESFFDKIMSSVKNRERDEATYKAGKHSTATKNLSALAGTLGARPLGDEEQAQLAEKSSFDSFLRRAGLYDVFAPAGPIGIVVDTTSEGPAVHSLKSSSPMLGLINPGDLIVGLDDEDTRGMTAATLTRLMAKKANQKERKITLLAAETY